MMAFPSADLNLLWNAPVIRLYSVIPSLAKLDRDDRHLDPLFCDSLRAGESRLGNRGDP